MKYLLVEDNTDVVHRFSLFATDNGTKYIFNNLSWSANVIDLLLQVNNVQLWQSNFHDGWLNCVVASFDELPTLSYIEQHYPELLI